MTTATGVRAVGVIPSRWGSTRLPGKSLVPLCGKPLLHWVAERVLRAKRLQAVLVATDDERIMKAAAEAGVRGVMTRADHPSGTDRIAEAVRGMDADVVVNIQGDEPLIEPALIDQLAELMGTDERWDMATAACPILGREELEAPSVVKVVCDAEGRALYFSRSVIPYVRNAPPPDEAAALHWRHIGIYAYRAPFLARLIQTPPSLTERVESLEQLRALHIGARIAVVPARERGLGVDTPQDIPIVEAEIRRRQAAGTL